jgi:hypothetical protein
MECWNRRVVPKLKFMSNLFRGFNLYELLYLYLSHYFPPKETKMLALEHLFINQVVI